MDQSEAASVIGGHQKSLEVIEVNEGHRSHWRSVRSLEVIGGHWRSLEVIGVQWRSLEVIGDHIRS